MIGKIIRWVVGILFIPFVAGYAMAFTDQLLLIRQVHPPELAFLLGVTGYLAFHAMITAPNRAYVFGHELMHATATWVSGGAVKGFRVGSTKGSVTTNKVTAFIALAPYLVPVYSVLWAFLYGMAGLFWNVKPLVSWFFFGLGFSLAFHLTFTVTALKEKQSDLDVTGPVLALGLILWANITFCVGVMALAIPEVQFTGYLGEGFHHTQELYRRIFVQLFAH